MSHALVWSLLFFAAVAALRAEELPPRPMDGFLDNAVVFNAAQAAEIKERIQETLQKDGTAIFVTTMTFISGSTVRDRSTALMRNWAGEASGLVLAYNRGEGQPALSLSPGFWRRYPSDEVAQLLQGCVPILTKEAVPPDIKLLQAITFISGEIGRMEAGRLARATLWRPQDINLAMVLGGALLGLIILAWLVSLQVRKRGDARRQRHYLPEVEVGIRLGAPHGGGTMAEASATDPR